MRHLFVTQDYPPDLGGMARRHAELCRRFAPDEVVVSTVRASGTSDFDRGESYPIERLPFSFAQAKVFGNQLTWSGAITRHVRAHGAEVVHLGNIRPCGYAVAIASRRTDTPYLVYVYGGDLLREREKTARSLVKRWGARDIFGRASGVVAISRWSADLARDVMERIGVERMPPVASIDLGTDPVAFHPSRDARRLRAQFGVGASPLLVTVARLVPHKGQDVSIRALAALADRHPDAHYLVIGDGQDATRLRALAASLGVGERVHLAGAVGDDVVAEAYATADVYIGLSRMHNGINVEGFGLSFVEAAASGTPSVAGDSGGVRSAVRDGETGFVVPPEDVGAVAAALDRLLGDRTLRERMGEVGRRAVETHYNWDRVARETLAFTYDVIGRKNRGGAIP